MIIDCISDLHGHYPDMESGDLLIVAGDLTANDTEEEYRNKFNMWMYDQYPLKYKKVVFIAGNHDTWIQKNVTTEFMFGCGEYLCDSGTEFEGLKIWGSPWTKSFEGMNPACMAFTEQTEDGLMKHFGKIPDDIDILVTHSPPYGVLDTVETVWNEREVVEHCGSNYLYGWLKYCGRPKLHVFGHIHEGYGMQRPNLGFIDAEGYPISVNASHMNGSYQSVNAPIRVVL